MKKITILCLFVFTSIVCIAQINSRLEKFQTDYAKDFSVNSKAVYLHLNKNILLENESLWFAGYVYDLHTGRPDSQTANLNISIFKEDGEFLHSEVLYTYFGKASGYLKLNNKSFQPGNYIIRASTNYIDSFEDDHSHTSTFKILGSENLDQPINQQHFQYDLQLLPEGGHLLANVMNTIGVKLLNHHGRGVEFEKGYVLNKNNDTLADFNSNKFGMASFNLNPKTQEDYKVFLKMKDGEKLESVIEEPETKGFSLSSTISPEFIRLSFLTNEKTYPEIKDHTFFLGLSKNGKIKTYAFKYPSERLTATFEINKDSLFSGVNTITIFNDNFEPLLERLVFNDFDTKRVSLKAERRKIKDDSLEILLSGMENQISNVSVSVLPGDTQAYEAQNNILSKFLLEPYLKGEIEDGAYYFSKDISKRRRNYDLDLLLLNQGWSKYDWNDNPKDNVKQPAIVQGFNIDGKIFERTRNRNQIFIRNERSGEMEIVQLKNDQSFAFEKMYIEDSTEIAIGMIGDRKGKIQKPSISLDITPRKIKKNYEGKIPLFKKHLSNTREVPKYFVSDAEVLDTVTIHGERTADKKKDFFIAPTTSASSDYIEIDENIARSNMYITDLIQKKFFIVRRTPAGVEITARMPSRIAGDASLPIPQIFLNGTRLRDDLNILTTLLTSEVKSIYINRSPAAGFGGFNQGGGVIRIQTKTGSERSGVASNSVTKITTSNGYQPRKKFYAPKYVSYKNKIFRNYGAIGWFPLVKTSQDVPVTLSVLNTLEDSLKIFIQGFTTDGQLISEELTLKN